VFDRRHFGRAGVLHPEVVLTDEDHRQLPDGGEVERFVERADVVEPSPKKQTAT